MKKSRFMGAVLTGICIFISMPSNAALIDNGGGLIYDDVLKITWAQPDALRTWDDANTWAAGLTLGGVSGWRQPYISVAEGAGPLGFIPGPVNCYTATELACRDNEMGYMFYHNLSGTLNQSILLSGDPDLALFPSLQSNLYWTGTEFDSGYAWGFFFNLGGQGNGDGKIYLQYTWAVHDGDIHPIPIPAAVWLFGTGLLGMIGIARRRTTKVDTKTSTPHNNGYNNIHHLSRDNGYQPNQQHP